MTPTAKCFLVALYELKRRNKVASMDGLIKILKGQVDDETEPLVKMAGFASCLSLKSKRGKNLLHSLIRNGFLDQKYIEGEYFLALTNLGAKVALESLTKVEAISHKEGKPKAITIRNI